MLANPRAPKSNAEVLELLLRFRNVVLWLNGHIHANRIAPRVGRDGGHSFWEVTTSSLVDWPCQARLVELFEAGDGPLGLGCPLGDPQGSDLAPLHPGPARHRPVHRHYSRPPGAPPGSHSNPFPPPPFLPPPP